MKILNVLMFLILLFGSFIISEVTLISTADASSELSIKPQQGTEIFDERDDNDDNSVFKPGRREILRNEHRTYQEDCNEFAKVKEEENPGLAVECKYVGGRSIMYIDDNERQVEYKIVICDCKIVENTPSIPLDTSNDDGFGP